MKLPYFAPLLAAAILSTACSDPFKVDRQDFFTNTALTSAFSTVPLGYSEVTSSFAGDGDGVPSMFLPGMRAPAFGGGLMGGGLGDAFAGAMSPGRGRGHEGPFGGRFGGGLTCTGTYNTSTQRFVCDPVTRGGITRTQTMQYTSAGGAVQQAFDTLTTHAVNVQSAGSGTASWARDENARGRGGPHHIGRIAGDTTTILSTTTTVNHASNRTVTGLASPSTQRTINGTSQGVESATGTSSRGNFTATRSAADTTKGLVVPVQNDRGTYPSAGQVIRTMRATVAFAGAAAVSTTRREVITYDGSSTAKVAITKDGVTQNCTMSLPRGRPSCS